MTHKFENWSNLSSTIIYCRRNFDRPFIPHGAFFHACSRRRILPIHHTTCAILLPFWSFHLEQYSMKEEKKNVLEFHDKVQQPVRTDFEANVTRLNMTHPTRGEESERKGRRIKIVERVEKSKSETDGPNREISRGVWRDKARQDSRSSFKEEGRK